MKFTTSLIRLSDRWVDGDWFHYMLHSQNKTYFLYFFSFVIRLKSSECKIWKKCTYCPIWFRPRALSLSNPTKGWSGQLCLLVWLLRSDSKFVSGDMIRSHSQWTGLLVIRLSFLIHCWLSAPCHQSTRSKSLWRRVWGENGN